jgi:hypothetical protein
MTRAERPFYYEAAAGVRFIIALVEVWPPPSADGVATPTGWQSHRPNRLRGHPRPTARFWTSWARRYGIALMAIRNHRLWTSQGSLVR